ncbi:MAG: GvpL/GvpF family gas vesicle protein [Ignavibacteriales bacterium]|nr:GvpL/GvpF family gas vesicle protein [Ignavibacteriales bacterium]
MQEEGKYLYGIIGAENGPVVPNGAIGLAGERVYTIRYAEIAAVVSDHTVCEIHPLRQDFKPHHEVIREVNRRVTIIPMKFGHIAQNSDDVLQFLKSNFSPIFEELRKLDNKVEMGLRVSWDVDSVFEYFLSNDRELERLRDRIFGKNMQPTYEEKLELGMLFARKVDEERKQHTDRIVAALEHCIVDVRINEPTDEKMVLNGAFLIERHCEKEYAEGVYRVAKLFDGHYSLDYNGPWAPYNFVELALKV